MRKVVTKASGEHGPSV